MKNVFKILFLTIITAVAFSSCSKDDDPADNDFFVGTYEGTISYTSSDKDISATGKVRVVKIGNNYNFVFSDGIPDLNGVEFQKDANTAISIGSDDSKYIRITNSSLSILYSKDGGIWTANCER